MSFIAITTQPDRTHRLFIARLRIHHGFWGSLFAAVGLRWMWIDRADIRDWFRFR